MSNQYYTLLTNTGRQLVAQATISQKLNITHIALGDGNGAVPTPSPTRSQLVKEKARFAVNSVQIDRNNTNWIEAEIIVPSNSGGYTIREIGVFAGTTLIAIGSFPATYKPLANEGGAREMAIKVVFSVENAQVVSVSLNQSLIYATQQWVEQNFVNHSEVVNSLNSTETTKPLSAAQGKALNESKSDKNHRHNWSEIDGKPSTYPPSTHRHNWNEIDGKPSTYPPSTHAHDWNSITGKPTTLVHTTGATFTGSITVPDLITQKLRSSEPVGLLQENNGNAQRLYTGGLLASNVYSDSSLIPENGIFAKGQIRTTSGFVGDLSGNSSTATKLQTPRTINGVAFDGTQNIELSAPTIWNGDLMTAEELNNAKKSGFYRVKNNPAIANLGLYNYGMLYVHKADEVIQQTYFAHKANAKGGCATRQTWTNDWSTNDWRIIDTNTRSTADLTDFTVQTLLNTANLNDIRAVGIYGQNANALATAERNYPEQWAGYLIVAPSAGVVQQEYTTYYHNNKYVRSFLEGRWREWKRIDGADWSSLRDKPSTFPASVHRHNWNEIDGKPSTYPPSTHRHNWSEIDGKPSTYPPSTHAHDWNSITGKPTTLVHTTGATFTGSITVPDLITQKLRSSEPVGLLQENNGNAQRLYTGGLLASNVYSDSSLIPENGIFAKGQIRTTSGFVGDLSGNSSTATKLQTPRNIALTGAVTGSVSFDGSQNVSISTQQTIQRVQKSMQIPTTHNFNNTPNVTVTGSVETFVDGRVVQHFTLVCSIFNFYRANAAQFYKNSGFSVNYFGEGGASFLELPLWTAMPNKVQRATLNIAAVENNYIHEALEWISCWESMWNTSKNIRDKAYFGFRRISGEADEKVQIHITVEGY